MDKLFEKIAGMDAEKKAEILDKVLSVLTSSVTSSEATYCDAETEEARKNCRGSSCINMGDNINNKYINNISIPITTTTTTTTSAKTPAICELWFSKFREICTSFSKPSKLTESRIERIKQRVAEGYTLEDFEKACRNMEASSWLKGKGWASFDWIIQSADNLAKLAEGHYNQRVQPDQTAGMNKRQTLLVELLETAADAFGKGEMDIPAMAVGLNAAIANDRYYQKLTADDLREVFRRGCSRQYDYHGLTISTVCGWFNAYRSEWLENRRKSSS